MHPVEGTLMRSIFLLALALVAAGCAPPAPAAAVQPTDSAATQQPADTVAVLPTDSAAAIPSLGADPSPSTQQPADTPVVSVSGEEGTDPPVAGYDRLPPGVNYVGDVRIKVYYPLGCAAQHAVPVDAQVFFQTAGGAETDGFKRSGDC
jgi:hypothetical protein